MSSALPALVGKRFLQRRDVKAVQFSNGAYVPDRKLERPADQERHGLGFKMNHLKAHLAGEQTYGHYLIDADDKCRVFVLDLDLRKSEYNDDGSLKAHTGAYVIQPTDWSKIEDEADYADGSKVIECDPYLAWRDRKNTDARAWYKWQMKHLARRLAAIITGPDFQLGCAVAYSGHKGIHIYGFFNEPVTAEYARSAADIVVELSGEWEPLRGNNFLKHRNPDPILGFPSFSLEVFPKQESLSGKNLGNLVRLPLGRNLKAPKDPTFFLDLNGSPTDFAPHPNPELLLESGDPFRS